MLTSFTFWGYFSQSVSTSQQVISLDLVSQTPKDTDVVAMLVIHSDIHQTLEASNIFFFHYFVCRQVYHC